MKSMNTKALVEGAIFASVTALLGILVYYMPLLSLLGMLWAAPIIIMGYRNGFKVSLVSAAAAGIIVSIFTEPFSGIYLFIVFGISGLVMGYLMNKKVNPGINMTVSGLVMAICSVGGLLLGFFIAGQTPTQVIEQLMKIFNESLDTMTNLYRSMGIPDDQLNSTVKMMRDSMAAMQYIIPTLFIISGMIFSFINYKVVKMILGRMKYQIEDVKPFSQWRLPDNFAIGMMIIIFLTLAASYLKIPNMVTVQMNMIYLVNFIFTIIGLSVISFMLNKYNVSKPFRSIIIFIVFFSLSNYLAIVGLVDAVFNIRKLDKRRIGGI